MLKTKKNRRIIYRVLMAGLFLVCSASVFIAAVKYGDDGGGFKANTDNHDEGLLWLTIDDQLGIAGANCDYSGKWPTGDGDEHIYSAGIWVGYMNVSGGIYVSNWENGYPGAGEWRKEGSEPYPLMSDDSNWQYRPSGVEQISGLDSYIKVNDNAAGELGEIKLIVERHGYQWDIPGHDDFIVFEYTITNDAGEDLPDVFFAMPFDNDVGGGLDYIDDLVLFEGNDTTDNWTNPQNPGEPWTNETPDLIPDENDAVNFPADTEANEFGKARMMSVMYDSGGVARDYPGYVGCRIIACTLSSDPGTEYDVTGQHSWDIMNDPATDAFRYGYMLDTGTFEEITTPYDWRMCQSVGPFEEFPANETIHWWAAVVLGSDLNDMRTNSDQVYADYLGADGEAGTDDDWVVLAPPVAPRLVSVTGSNKITLRWNPNYEIGKNTENDPDSRSDVVDFDGYVVWRSTVGFDAGWEAIMWVDKLTTDGDAYQPWGWRGGERVPDGTGSYTEPNLTGVTQITYEGIDADSSPIRKDAKGYYEWVDNNVINGATYYYSVTPYDFGTKHMGGYQPNTNEKPRIGGKTSNAVIAVPMMAASSSLDNVTVAPNPYRGSADWDEWTSTGIRLGKVWFMNLPAECTITIYTISGDPVRILEHRSKEIGAEPWDLTGGSGVTVASGVYVYQIEAGDDTVLGKLAVIIGQSDN